MKKLNDPDSLGMLVGLVGGMVGWVVDWSVSRLDPIGRDWSQQAGDLTISSEYRNSKYVRPIGIAAIVGISALQGIMYVRYVAVTGRRAIVPKTMLFAWASWMILHGVGAKLSYPFKSSTYTSLAVLAGNLASSFTQMALVPRLAAPSLLTKAQVSSSRSPIAVNVKHDINRTYDDTRVGYLNKNITP